MSRYNISNVRAAFVDVRTGALTKFGIDVLQRISEVLGLPGGNILEDSINRDSYDSTAYSSGLEETFKRIRDLEHSQYDQSYFEPKIIGKTLNRETYTAKDNMFIYMKNYSTLYLPLNPVTNSVIHMTKDSTKAIVNGNGRLVNGRSEISFYKDGLARTFHYFVDSDEWRIR